MQKQPQQFQQMPFAPQQEQSPVQQMPQIQKSQIDMELETVEKEVPHDTKYIQNEETTNQNWLGKVWYFITEKYPQCSTTISFLSDITAPNGVAIFVLSILSHFDVNSVFKIIIVLPIWLFVLWFNVMKYANELDSLEKQKKFIIYKNPYNLALIIISPLIAVYMLYSDLLSNLR